MNTTELQREKERLLNTYGIIDKVIEDVERRYDSLGKTISDNDVNDVDNSIFVKFLQFEKQFFPISFIVFGMINSNNWLQSINNSSGNFVNEVDNSILVKL